MILHIIENHSAGLYYVGKFEEMFPKANITLNIKGKKEVEILKGEEKHSFNSVKEAAKHIDFKQIKVIVVEFLSFNKEYIILRYIPLGIPIVCWMFGGDLYDHLLHYNGYQIYAPATQEYQAKRRKLWSMGKSITYFFLRPFLHHVVDRMMLSRITGLITCTKPDYELACTLFKKSVDFVDIHPRFIILDLPMSDGDGIIVGHSASMTVNHLYALDYIKDIDFGESRLFMPLSYNIQRDTYRQLVMEKYKEAFGERVNFLLDYMDKKSYRKSFLSYKVAIFPSWRQEALANIYICLQLGVKVFLSVHNPCYKDFKDAGYHIFALEDIKGSEDFNPLTQEEKEYNRTLFIKLKKERDEIVPVTMKNYFIKYI